MRDSVADRVVPSSPLNLGVRSLLAVSISAALILLAVLVWQLIPILVLIFAGVLVAIFIRALASWVETFTLLSGPWALAAVGLGLVVLIAGLSWGLSPYVTEQVQRLSTDLPGAFEGVSERLQAYPWGEFILGQVPPVDEFLAEHFEVWGQLGGVVTTTLGLVVDVLVIIAVGAYFAVNPRLYVVGIISLAPGSRRARLAEVIEEASLTLRWWLAGRVLAMLFFGTVTGIVLWLLGVPMALTLGLVTGFLSFVPFLGPLVALVPAALLATVEAPIVSLWVVALFAGLQVVESYLLMPRLQRGAVNEPIALLLVAQVVMILTVGVWGWLIASPMVVLIVVLVKMLYVQDILGEPAALETPEVEIPKLT